MKPIVHTPSVSAPGIASDTRRMTSLPSIDSEWAPECGYLFPDTSKCCGYLITSGPSSNHSGLYYTSQQILLTLINMRKREGYFSQKVLWKILPLLIFFLKSYPLYTPPTPTLTHRHTHTHKGTHIYMMKMIALAMFVQPNRNIAY